MGRTIIVYYDFAVTSGNHAGMAHLAKLISEELPQVEVIRSVPHHYKLGRYVGRVYAVLLAFYFSIVLKKDDKVFFFEYLTKGTAYQTLTAQYMRSFGIKSNIYVLIHLSPQHLLELYPGVEFIRDKLALTNKIFVFGSSLSKFLKSLDVQKEVITTFHYVDTRYYKPGRKRTVRGDKLNVICIGSLKRNFLFLRDIVAQLPQINFHILMGKKNIKTLFEDMANVKLYSFLEEEEMLELMQSCDISLSVLDDTVGSNVITTSMAVGLIQVVSDVGSIRDYCNESDSFICKQVEDYTNAIQILDQDDELLEQMKTLTLQKAATISHEAFIKQFKEFI
jgi:glycosyltransferase involved in cell wall biosynthesis